MNYTPCGWEPFWDLFGTGGAAKIQGGSRGEPSRAEPSRVEPRRAEPETVANIRKIQTIFPDRCFKLGAGGKPSTWLPPGGLVEHLLIPD